MIFFIFSWHCQSENFFLHVVYLGFYISGTLIKLLNLQKITQITKVPKLWSFIYTYR